MDRLFHVAAQALETFHRRTITIATSLAIFKQLSCYPESAAVGHFVNFKKHIGRLKHTAAVNVTFPNKTLIESLVQNECKPTWIVSVRYSLEV